MTATIEVAIDALEAEPVAAWWAAALGYRRLSAHGPYVVLGPRDRDARPSIVIQEVDEVAAGKTPVHLDLRVDDPDAEVARLTKLGAVVEWVVDDTAHGGSAWTTLTDPWGTLFCVCPARPDPTSEELPADVAS